MKATVITVLLAVFIVVACAPAAIPVSTETALPTTTFTPVTPTPTPTWWVTPAVTATPLDLTLTTKGKIDSIIEQLHPGICTGINLAALTPPPRDVPPPPALTLTEIEVSPNPESHYVSEIADNLDKSRQAFIACDPEKCVDVLYIKESKTGKVYEINFGIMPWRPIQWLTWINKDALVVAQSSNPHYGLMAIIDFNKQEYVYYGMAMECWESPTPKP